MKIFELILLLVFYSGIALINITSLPAAVYVIGGLGLFIAYLVIIFRSEKIPVQSKRLSRLKSGLRLIWLSGMTIIPETIIIFAYANSSYLGVLSTVLMSVFAAAADILLFLAGFIKTAIGAKQIKLTDYIFLLIFWWVPVVNLILIRKFYKTGKREYIFELDKAEMENARAENEICRTKYPILMVHGIFFRDWQLLNYWGRVPAALIRNGATVYYGNQQSARSIPDSAAELREQILTVIRETGAEKVNIIAHSKGGLDSRYAISRLGMDEYVATLTTINTPHKGCDMVDYLLEKLPDGLAQWIARRYNGIFGKLGDKSPDFMAGVKDLSALRLRDYDKEVPDSPKVSYRSYMSVMRNVMSAGFPLNLGYLLIKRLNGRNDGLVWEGSAEHGVHKLVTAPGVRGISHGDTIDLFRENIEGYDIREFYTALVADLKKQGY